MEKLSKKPMDTYVQKKRTFLVESTGMPLYMTTFGTTEDEEPARNYCSFA